MNEWTCRHTEGQTDRQIESQSLTERKSKTGTGNYVKKTIKVYFQPFLVKGTPTKHIFRNIHT